MTIETKNRTKPELETRKWEELRLLYTLVLDDIRFHKNQQITFLYYTIALYSVTIFLLSLFSSGSVNYYFRVALSVLSAIIMSLGIWFTWLTQTDINKGRRRVQKICPQFTKEFNNALEGEKESKRTAKWSRFTYLIFILIQIVGELIVLSIIWEALFT